MIRRCLFVLTAIFVAGLASAEDPMVAKGRQTFLNHCARCHGEDAKGDGFDAKRVPVVPRNLTEGTFKFQTTAQGTPPSDADLMWTLNHGMAGAGMPSFANLNDDTKKSLIAYIKTLSPIFNDKPEPLPAPKIRAHVDLAKGKEIFKKLQCSLCHGENGHANGTSAFTLKDKWDRPIQVANLTEGWRYRDGDSATQIYYRLMAGINGAPMPSYAEAVSSEEAWQLAKYVESLQNKSSFKPDVQVAEVMGQLPVTSDDAAWKNAPMSLVNLEGQIYKDGKKEHLSVYAVSVQVLRNKDGLAFRLSWDDPTPDTKTPSDQFLMAIRPKGFKGKGTQNLHNLYFPGAEPLDIYMWTAQNPAVIREGVGSLDEMTRSGARFPNSISAESAYNDGTYTLTFQRPWSLTSSDSWSTEDKAIKVGFAAWNGGNNEAGLKRSVSQWITVHLVEASSHH